MIEFASLVSTALNDFYSSLQTMFAAPGNMIRFFIPVTIIFLSSFAVRHYTKKQRLDSIPNFEKKRERFALPDDIFNEEVSNIMRGDYSTQVSKITMDFYHAYMEYKEFKILIRRYRRYRARMGSSFKRVRERSSDKSKIVLNQLLDLHQRLGELAKSAEKDR